MVRKESLLYLEITIPTDLVMSQDNSPLMEMTDLLAQVVFPFRSSRALTGAWEDFCVGLQLGEPPTVLVPGWLQDCDFCSLTTRIPQAPSLNVAEQKDLNVVAGFEAQLSRQRRTAPCLTWLSGSRGGG